MNTPQRLTVNTSQKLPRRRLGLLLMIPLVLGMIALCVLARQWRESLKLEAIAVSGTRSLTKSAVTALANVAENSQVYSIDLMDVREKIMKAPVCKDVRLNREYPGVLRIDVVERDPIAALNCGTMRYVDAEGVVLPYLDGDRKLDLPVITGIEGLQVERVGKPILNKELFLALGIIQQAQALDSSICHMISELDMNKGGDIRINSVEGGIPIWLGREDIPKKLLLLQTFWLTYVNSEEAQKLKSVDLRFDDQVVVRWSDKAGS